MNPVAEHIEMRDKRKKAHKADERSYGLMCTKHFAQGDATWAEVDNCIDCEQADIKDFLHTQQCFTIDPDVMYGRHIPLTCKNHPQLFWHTKNIGPIGCRHIYFASPSEVECDCSVRDLIPVKKEDK
jgi:hypothetical protein